MSHLRRKKAKSAGRYRPTFRLVELLAHAQIECAGNNRHVLDLRMPVCRVQNIALDTLPICKEMSLILVSSVVIWEAMRSMFYLG
jgi:hypothetical protein